MDGGVGAWKKISVQFGVTNEIRNLGHLEGLGIDQLKILDKESENK